MRKFDVVMNFICDNIALGVLIFICLSFVKCSTTPEASTIRIQERSQPVLSDLDLVANDCKSVECKDAIGRAKELIKDSLDVMIEKDHTIQVKDKQIASESFYASVGRALVWGIGCILLIGLLYLFRNQIMNAIKILI